MEKIENIIDNFIKTLKIINDDNDYMLGMKLESISSIERDKDNKTFFYVYTNDSKQIMAKPIDGKARQQSIKTGLLHCIQNNDKKYNQLSNPDNIYGKAIIKYIVENLKNKIIYPDEIEEKDLFEGAKKQITVNAYERSSYARQECIGHYGTICFICDFNFEKVYGDIGKGFIHVHHIKPLSEIDEQYKINPVEDLTPVCPNCHAMLHKRKPAYSIEEIKNLIDNKNL